MKKSKIFKGRTMKSEIMIEIEREIQQNIDSDFSLLKTLRYHSFIII